MPANPDPLAGFPSRDARADRIDDAGDLVSGDSRVLEARPEALFGQRVAVADAPGRDPEAHRCGAGLRDFAFHEFERSLRAGDLNCTHPCHSSSFESRRHSTRHALLEVKARHARAPLRTISVTQVADEVGFPR